MSEDAVDEVGEPGEQPEDPTQTPAALNGDSTSVEPEPTPAERAEYQTLANGVLSPRHRRFAQLASSGKSNKQIAEELGYCDSRVSILRKNPYIAQEIARLQERIFEESIQKRMKDFAEPALNNIQQILTDRTNRVKTSEKMALSQWVVEKLDGKATQKTDIGENLLGVLMDRLDAMKGAGRRVGEAAPPPDIETRALPSGETPEPPAPKDELAEWIDDFMSQE